MFSFLYSSLSFTMKKWHLNPMLVAKFLSHFRSEKSIYSTYFAFASPGSPECHLKCLLFIRDVWAVSAIMNVGQPIIQHGWAGFGWYKKKSIRGFFYSLFVLYFILIPAGDLVFDVKIEFFRGAVIIIPSSS